MIGVTAVGGVVNGFINSVKNLLGGFIEDPNKSKELDFRLDKMGMSFQSDIEQTEREVIKSRTAVILAELKQDNLIVKITRPAIVWVGLLVFIWNYAVIPSVAFWKAWSIPSFDFPEMFWVPWGGIVASYVIARQTEKNKRVDNIKDALNG